MASSTLPRVQSCARALRHITTSFSTTIPTRLRAQHLPSRQLFRSNIYPSLPFKQTRSILTSTKPVKQQENESKTTPTDPLPDLSTGFNDTPSTAAAETVDWTRSFHGMSVEAFPKEAREILLAPLDPAEVEVKPDGILYLPEIKYRRILNKAFGPGAWGLAPRGETIVTAKAVTREYGLVVLGRLVSVARGEQDYFSPEGIPTAAEGCKSNALTRCCKDLGVASELWDPRFIRKFTADHVKEVWAEHLNTKKKKKLFLRKQDKVSYPWKESKP